MRLRITITGAVQGVGFRPFVYRLASELGLMGYVTNTAQGVLIEVEGLRSRLDEFWHGVQQDTPPLASIQSIESAWGAPKGYARFDIRHSVTGGERTAVVFPDIATCPECLAELFDPANRRYRYPFTNCTHCGPRYTILEAIPYDRVNTSMKRFVLCADCFAEYHDPANRRFHAQPNACPVCGPQLELWDGYGCVISTRDAALAGAVEAIRLGKIVALKGLGGFHLVTDARNDYAVAVLRARKRREEKPLALMFPSLGTARAACVVSPLEERLLCSTEAPIVLLRRKYSDYLIAPSVAPGNPFLGVMLPYTPLHHLLMRELGFPIVATSGNLSDEPICFDEEEARERLMEIADLFLVHNRPIVRPVDDSVVRVMMGRELMLRRARGYAPLPAVVIPPGPTLLAVGGHLKNTVCLIKGANAYLSQHLGDLDTLPAYEAFTNAVKSVETLHDAAPEYVACDLHPDYRSTAFAQALGLPVMPVQHHHAHVAACMAENNLEGPVLGVSWDGTGYGTDGAIWGGEFLIATRTHFDRAAHLRSFRLPGGDKAAREPRRSAIGLLYELWGPTVLEDVELPCVASFFPHERTVLKSALANGVNTPLTTSAGRLFDAVASLSGLRQLSTFEGQAAMELEWAGADFGKEPAYTVTLKNEAPCFTVDWSPMMLAIVEDARKGGPLGLISARFHNTLAEVIVAVAKRLGIRQVVLTGGCFQNKYLTERTVARLNEAGYSPFWHRRVPPNDGGIALGQAVYAAAVLRQRQETEACV